MAEQHSIDEPRLGVGLTGWQGTAWAEAYYPGDLPADWRLSYYANDFNCVHLPEADWVMAGDADLEAWLDSVAEGFRFYLSASSAVPLARMLKVASLLGAQLGGFLLQQDDRREPPAALRAVQDLPGVSAAWQGADARLILQLDMGGLDLRAQRACLEGLSDRLKPEVPHALLLTGEGVGPEQASQLRLLAEMMGIA